MSVAQILAEKGSLVVTIEGHLTIGDAIKLLNKHRIGAVVVVDSSGGVQGIFSERDVVRAFGEIGADAVALPISDRMTRKVATCTPAASLTDMLSTMTEGKFRHLPVVEDGRLGGMVSIGDIVKYRLAQMEAESQALKDYIAAG